MKITIRSNEEIEQKLNNIISFLQMENPHLKITKSDAIKYILYKESNQIENFLQKRGVHK